MTRKSAIAAACLTPRSLAPQRELAVPRRLAQRSQSVLSPRWQWLSSLRIVGRYGSAQRAAFITWAIDALRDLNLVHKDTLRFDPVDLLRRQTLVFRRSVGDGDGTQFGIDGP